MKPPRLDRPPLWMLRGLKPGTLDLEAMYDAMVRIFEDCPGHDGNKHYVLAALEQLIDAEESRHPRKVTDEEIHAAFERVSQREGIERKFDAVLRETADELGVNKETVRRWYRRWWIEGATYVIVKDPSSSADPSQG